MSKTVKPILALQGICKSYGTSEVLRDVNLEIYGGESVALLGENGAGKSTLSGIIAGAIKSDKGQMTWLERPYQPQHPRHAIDAGIGMIQQELKLLPHLSIAENVFVGRWPKKYGKIDRKKMRLQAQKQLKRLGLNLSATCLVEGLSIAAQQLIEIAKALALNARLLILDEPTAALGTVEKTLLFNQIKKLKSEGVGIIYISHRLDEIRQIAERIVVLRDGIKVAHFETAAVPVRTVVETMVGRSLDRMFPPIRLPKDEVIFEVKNASSFNGDFNDINFQVHKGEIFAIAGLVGAGRTALVRAITGADNVLIDGQICLYGRDITPRRPWQAIQNGIVLVPEDRKLQGLIIEHNIAENIGYANKEAVSLYGLINRRHLDHFATINIKRFAVKGQIYQNAGQLSGGNQQKIVIAKWLARNPQVVVLDEPTRGIDVGARSSIYDIIAALAARGVAVIIVSSDLEEIIGISNRILVMAQGRQIKILDRNNANDISIMELATR